METIRYVGRKEIFFQKNDGCRPERRKNDRSWRQKRKKYRKEHREEHREERNREIRRKKEWGENRG